MSRKMTDVMIITAKTDEKYQHLCEAVLTGARAFVIRPNPLDLHFVRGRGEYYADLVFNYKTQKIEIQARFPENKIRLLQCREDTGKLEKLVNELPMLREKGFGLSSGSFVLCKYLSESSKKAGAGYNYIPDEDEYEEVLVQFMYQAVRFNYGKLPDVVITKLTEWFGELKRKYDEKL